MDWFKGVIVYLRIIEILFEGREMLSSQIQLMDIYVIRSIPFSK